MKNAKITLTVLLTIAHLFGNSFTVFGEETDPAPETGNETSVEPAAQDNGVSSQQETQNSSSEPDFVFDFASTADDYSSNPQVQETPVYVEPYVEPQPQPEYQYSDTPVAVATTSGSNTGSFTLPAQEPAQNAQPEQTAPVTENIAPVSTTQPVAETGRNEESTSVKEETVSSTVGSTTANTTDTKSDSSETYQPRMTFEEAVTYSAVNGRGNYGTWIPSKTGNIATEDYQETAREGILTALNAQRTEAGLNELKLTDLGAQDWAEIMCETGLYEHAALGGKYGISRNYSNVGENICIAAYRSSAELLAAVATEKWNDSEGHYRTRMRDRYVYYDVAVAMSDQGYCFLVERFAGPKNN